MTFLDRDILVFPIERSLDLHVKSPVRKGGEEHARSRAYMVRRDPERSLPGE